MLMLKEANRMTREQLRRIPTPEGTSTHRPVPHYDVVQTLLDRAKGYGLIPTSETYACAEGSMDGKLVPGARLFGTIDFSPAPGIVFPNGCGPSAGIRNSHDKSFSLSVLSGARVFICENGVLSAEHIVSRKHTSGIDIGASIEQAMDQFMESIKGFNATHDRMVNAKLSDATASHFVVEAAKRGAFASNMILPVLAEFEAPTHPEFAERNAWNLYQAATEKMKSQSETRQYDGFKALTETFNAMLN